MLQFQDHFLLEDPTKVRKSKRKMSLPRSQRFFQPWKSGLINTHKMASAARSFSDLDDIKTRKMRAHAFRVRLEEKQRNKRKSLLIARRIKVCWKIYILAQQDVFPTRTCCRDLTRSETDPKISGRIADLSSGWENILGTLELLLTSPTGPEI